MTEIAPHRPMPWQWQEPGESVMSTCFKPFSDIWHDRDGSSTNLILQAKVACKGILFAYIIDNLGQLARFLPSLDVLIPFNRRHDSAFSSPPLVTRHSPPATRHPPLATRHSSPATRHPPLVTHKPAVCDAPTAWLARTGSPSERACPRGRSARRTACRSVAPPRSSRAGPTWPAGRSRWPEA
jgi:hypothetical protein